MALFGKVMIKSKDNDIDNGGHRVQDLRTKSHGFKSFKVAQNSF